MKRILRISLIVGATMSSWSAAAQGYFPNITVSDFPDPVVTDAVDSGAIVSGASGTAPQVQGQKNSLYYNYSRVVSERTFQKFLDGIRSHDPSAAQQLEEINKSSNLVSQIDTAMRSVGLNSKNVADCYAVWAISAVQAFHGTTSTPSAATYASVSNQFSGAIIASGVLVRLQDSKKQELAETLLMQAATFDSWAANAAEDASIRPNVVSVVKETARASGLDLDTMVLTEQGFRPSGRHSNAVIPASDPTAPVADQASVAAPAATANDNIAVPKSVLYGGLAVLGLGGAYWFGKNASKKG